MLFKRILTAFILLFIYLHSGAQSYHFRNYQVSSGISSNTVTCILQDKKGFMWFGTRNGLNRFDGDNFRIFKNNSADSMSIGSNSIQSLYEDQQERLWIGTYNGIYIYDSNKESFTRLKESPHGETRYIRGDGKNNIWFISDFILYRYDTKTAAITSFQMPGEQTTNLHISEARELWITTNSGSVKKFDYSRNDFMSFVIFKNFVPNSANQIQEIYVLNDSSIIISTMKQVLLHNLRNSESSNLFTGYSWANNIHTNQILRQSRSEFWFGTENGLYIYDTYTKKAIHLQKEHGNPYSITDNVIYAFCKDVEGGTWVATFFGGVNYYSKQFNRFQKFLPGTGRGNLSGNLVHEICTDNFGNIWIGTEDAGLNKLNPKSNTITQFSSGRGPGYISYTNLHGLLSDKDKLWIGTYEHGLDVMDIRSGKVIRRYRSGADSNSLKSDFIVTLYKTRDSTILAGTWNGMFRYNRAKDNFSPMPFFNMQIQAIYEDEDGTLWACSYGNGVYYRNPRSGISGNMRHIASNSHSLINNYVNHLFADSKNNLWFCTEDGLTRYHKPSGKITNFTTANGLPDNQTFRVLEDKKGHLWISTANGLAQFDPLTNQFKKYKTASGLITEQFNYNSAYSHYDGRLYFGSVKGMISFDPEEFVANPFVPPVYITGFQVNNREISIGKDDSPIKQSIIYTRELELPYDQSNISIDVAALSYTAPEMNGYMYKMEGLEKEWTTMKGNRKIYYTKLPPGTYTFKLKGSSSEDVWNSSEKVMKITITPPFWSGTLAYLFYTIAAALIIITVIRYYHFAMKEKNKRKLEAFEMEKEREIHNAKIEFFTNIAHEIRTPLTLIKMPLDKLLNKENFDPETDKSLNVMKKNTNRLIDLTNQLLDFRKAEASKFSLNFIRTDISELIREVFTNFKPAAEQKNLQFRLELPRINLHAYVDIEALKKILSNLINNAVKYSHSLVIVKLFPFNSEDTAFNIEIKNDGYTIPYDQKEKIFEPFYRLKETEKESGTGIGLPLSRSLSELHKGILELKPSQDHLNIFHLSLPIHQDREIDLQQFECTDEVKGDVITADAHNADPSKPSILIVEDNKDISRFITGELQHTYKVFQAANGEEALNILLKENIQVVISDIMMPVMDGIQLCKKMKTDLQFSHIPIILLTAKTGLHSKIEGLEVGADAYIEKPFALEHLQAQINNLIVNRNKLKDYFASSPLTHLRGIACSTPDKNFLEQLNKVILENISDSEFDVEHLSRLMNMSRPTLYRKIKALSDLTPNELIHLSRLKQAAELLASGNYKISEVSDMIGYSLQTNFSRDFHKQFGVTPSQYVSSLNPVRNG